MNNESILVTGGAGFIGSNVSDKLISLGKKVICLDDFNDYHDPEIKERNIRKLLSLGNFLLYRGDIRDSELVGLIFNKNKPNKVIHLAARAGVRNSFQNPELYNDVNVNGTRNLLDASVSHSVKNFIFASSSSVYGTNKKTPFSESDEIEDLISPYAETKKQGELLASDFANNKNLNINCLRFFTVYGPRGRRDMAPYKFVDSIFKGIPIKIFTDEQSYTSDGFARDYTYVDDIVSGIITSLNYYNNFEIFNLGNGNPISINQFISTIEKVTGRKSIKEFVGRQEGDVPITYADISKAKQLLGYNPQTPISEGINKYFKWYQLNN